MIIFFDIFFILVTANQIERLWSRFTSLDKQQKGYLTRDDFLRIPELAINPLGDRIVHAFFRDSVNDNNDDPDTRRDGPANFNGTNAENGVGNAEAEEQVRFHEFVRVLAHFRPIKKKPEKNKLNQRDEKLKCKHGR